MKIQDFKEYCKIFNLNYKVIKLEDFLKKYKKGEISKNKIQEENGYKFEYVIDHNRRTFTIKDELIDLVLQLIDYNQDYYEKIKLFGQILWSNGPTQYLLKLSYERNKERSIIINEKSSYMYSKKNDIFYEGIINKEMFLKRVKLQTFFIIVNEQSEPLGIGEIKSPRSKYNNDDIAIYNSYNLGKYIR